MAADGADLLIWERSSLFLCTAIATSSPMERLPTRALCSRRETLVEIGSCTKTFTTTLFALAINRNQIVADASAMDRFITPAAFIARALCSSIFAAAIPSPKARQW